MEINLKRILIGKPFSSQLELHERLDKVRGLAVFASDPISSNAYATEAIISILILLGSGAIALAWPIALGIALLVTIVIFSYVQTILHYPGGGGAYTVSKDNLGEMPSLIAAGALLVDYTLTVSVSISAGVRAVASAFPAVFPYRVAIALLVLALITWANLRGVRESGTIFAVPTYAFVVGVLVMVAIGLVRYFGLFGAQPLVVAVEEVEPVGTFTSLAYAWILLRAFAAGCTALTGIEAISNGVQAFKPPEATNAAKTMVAMGAIAMSLFVGISFLATHLQLVPTEENSLLSQLTQAVTGGGFLYYWVQLFTMAILFLAANTGYQDFPRLSAFLARDGYMPRWLATRGDRLVYSSGIFMLAVFGGAIIVLFQADEIAMLPLYALGVMMCFSLSQAGMVRLMGKVGRLQPGEVAHTGETTIHYEPGWWWKRIVNLVGAITTSIVFVVLLATKFVEGAWIVVVAVPLLIVMFRAINRHYDDLADKLSTHHLTTQDLTEVARVAIVPIADVHRGTLRAINYAKNFYPDVRAVVVATDEVDKEHILARWNRFREITDGAELIFIDWEYRTIFPPLLDYIEHVNNIEFPDHMTTVIVPEFTPDTLTEQLLHTQTARYLRNNLRRYEDIVIIDLPFHV